MFTCITASVLTSHTKERQVNKRWFLQGAAFSSAQLHHKEPVPRHPISVHTKSQHSQGLWRWHSQDLLDPASRLEAVWFTCTFLNTYTYSYCCHLLNLLTVTTGLYTKLISDTSGVLSDPIAPTIPKIVDKKSTDTSLMVLLDPPQQLSSSDIYRR